MQSLGPHGAFLTPWAHGRLYGEGMIRDYFDRLDERSSGMKERNKAVGTKRLEGAGGHIPRASSRRAGLSVPISKRLPWRPPSGSWEDHIQTIDGCDDAGNGDLIIYVTWKGGKQTRHKAQVLHAKCPQKVRPLAARQTLTVANRCSCFVSTIVSWYCHDHKTKGWHLGFFQLARSSLCLRVEKGAVFSRPSQSLSQSGMGTYLVWFIVVPSLKTAVLTLHMPTAKSNWNATR